MTLAVGAKLFHNGTAAPVELIEFVENYLGDKIWLARDLPNGMTHIMRIKPKDVLTPYRENTQ